jgi:redox-sensing transcriptional repressor
MMKKSKRIISRLSRYKNVLYRFRELGYEKVFSDYLADEIGVTSSQVRKDFSIFGITGNKRAGYNINSLIENLETIFQKGTQKKVVIVGAGRLGSALSKYRGFSRVGTDIVAAFDTDPDKNCEEDGEIPIYPIEKLEQFVKDNSIDIGILTVPEQVAQSTFERMAAAGIKGVLNFAPVPVKPVEGCQVSTYCVEVEMENLVYFVNEEAKAENEE